MRRQSNFAKLNSTCCRLNLLSVVAVWLIPCLPLLIYQIPQRFLVPPLPTPTARSLALHLQVVPYLDFDFVAHVLHPLSDSSHALPPQYSFQAGLDYSDTSQVYPIGPSSLELDSSFQIVSHASRTDNLRTGVSLSFSIRALGQSVSRTCFFLLLSLLSFTAISFLPCSIVWSRSRLQCSAFSSGNSIPPSRSFSGLIRSSPCSPCRLCKFYEGPRLPRPL